MRGRIPSLTRLVLLSAFPLCLCGEPSSGAEPRPLPAFERIVIDPDFPGGYQVEVADVNGDGKPDVVALGGGTCAWYENPTWKKRIVTGPKQTPGIISSATADVDGDGKAEIAIAFEFAMNQPTKGKLLVATQGKGLDDPWTTTHVADIGSIHRLRWARYQLGGAGDVPGRPAVKWTDLIVAPIFGPSAKPPVFDQEPAHLVRFATRFVPPSGGRPVRDHLGAPLGPKPADPKPVLASDPFTGDYVKPEAMGQAPVVHAIDVVDLSGKGIPDILWASNLGVTRHYLSALMGVPRYESELLIPGAPGDAPKKGASEVHAGRLKDGRRFLATVEPWHGTDVAIYLSGPQDGLKFGRRTVIDTSLKEGHALWVADVDGDGDDEVFAGFRGPGTSVLGYDFDGKTWTRTVVDPDIAAQDLRGGDLDGDGTPDVVAIGGKTHNVVWYRPRKD